ncbi:hypothetical protein FDP41_013065 [Naegleria fowleri]|uniref:Fe2OG dioxygenase domain-containing protein n=1 Tax=Naegleria fowleri TaxID=5763 RepID=A0A6A5C1D7_NAEFO|nr:uncharacterized protein FDP41_013065 [Naegleria fowleri]KAF0980582.1 hypothetical protein FDP41_013065 [Naegleria fowleri]CAG4709625.1 unnamed protein product [Naegleria fowleri]
MKRIKEQTTILDLIKSESKKKKVENSIPIKTSNVSSSTLLTSTNTTNSSTSQTAESAANFIYLINDIDTNGAKVKYVSNFLSKTEAKQLFDKLMQACTWERDEYNIFGKKILSPRKISAFGETNYVSKLKGNYSQRHRRPTHNEWPEELLALKEKVESFTGEKFTFALINRYDSGQDSIMWHSDQEKDLAENSSIVSISLGAVRDFQFRPIPEKHDTKSDESEKSESSSRDGKKRNKNTIITKALENGSMVVMNYQTQRNYQHALPKRKNVQGVRLNVTFRHVVR